MIIHLRDISYTRHNIALLILLLLILLLVTDNPPSLSVTLVVPPIDLICVVYGDCCQIQTVLVIAKLKDYTLWGNFDGLIFQFFLSYIIII